MNFFRENKAGELIFLSSDNIPFIHGFSTRLGGVSTGHLSSLNFSVKLGDSEANVKENLSRFASAVGFDPGSLIVSEQEHTTEIKYVTKKDCGKIFPRNDGFITDDKDVTIAVKTADCAPVLLAGKRFVSAVHAGWKGTVGGIAKKAFSLLLSAGERPEDIEIAIGPCIHRCCFEVKEDFIENVSTALSHEFAMRHISKSGTAFFADLVGMNIELLLDGGADESKISVFGECTACNHEKYFSHRKTKGKRGVMYSVITPNLK